MVTEETVHYLTKHLSCSNLTLTTGGDCECELNLGDEEGSCDVWKDNKLRGRIEPEAVVALVGVPEGLRMPRARPLQSARRANEQAKMKTTDYQEREMKQERFCVGSG